MQTAHPKSTGFPTTVRHMTDNRNSGIALLCGSIGGIVTMAIHPTSAGVLTPAQFEQLAIVSGIAHTLAMISFLLLFLGALGLTRLLWTSEAPDKSNHLAISALVTFAFAAVAVLIATAVSGFIVPQIMKHMIRDVAANKTYWLISVDAIFQINQAFSRVYSIAASVSIVLWSASALRNRAFGRTIAFYGCVLAPVLILLLIVGHLRLDVHGMAAVVFSQAVWFAVVGVQLMRKDQSDLPASGVEA
jgi:hypothetical protein